MEAVPRMPMLSFELKQCPEYVDFGPVLKQYIKTHYGEDPAHYNKACTDLEQLRQSAIHVSHDFMGCSTLKKYYAQLQFLQGRFPMREDGECNINFTWEDVFLGREVTIADVKFEQACILFNIGSLHSILGSIETRHNADGMKVSCTHFQCAAWAFEYLRDHFGSSNLSVDMSHEVLTFQVNLMLAQAQECILEKSMIDSRKNTITAKVAAQVVEFYRGVIRSLQAESMDAILGSRKFKDWKKRAELKILFYEVITNYYMGKNSEEQEKFGECVAYFTLSYDKLKECVKLAKNESSEIQESLRFMNDVVGGKYQAAKKDNDFVYHDKIPAADTLPEVKGASLVKGIPFNWNDPEVSGPDIFQKLVPMSAHEASSMYSEEKAKLLRQVCGEVEEKNVALLQFMSSLNLDPSKLNFEPERLPQELLEKCAAVSVRPNAIKDLTDAMGAVSNSATEVHMAIEEINSLLENDAQEEEEFQKQFGKRSTNPMLPEIKKECDRFQEGHKKGNQSNIDLHKAMNTHITNLKLLAGPLEDIKNHLPSLERDMDPETEAINKELQKLLNKVEEMKNQRSMLEEQFRSKVKEDDITNQIVSQDGSNNTMVMFEQQLKKHDDLIGFIRQNLDAQDNILRALTDANARYANTRRATAETIARREATIEGLKNSYDVYEDLLAKSQKGLEFYKKLESNINRLLERCRGLCKQQAEERKLVQDRLKPKEVPAKPMPSPVNQRPVPSMDRQDGPHGPAVTAGGLSGPLGPMPDLHSSLQGFEGPKLKDYLPFMKPKTFGKMGTGSLPSSGVSSPVQLPQGPESVPSSPLQGMSDEDLRRLGITDPKVLAMIKAHSLPSSGGPDPARGGLGTSQMPRSQHEMSPRHSSPSHMPTMTGSVPSMPTGHGPMPRSQLDMGPRYPSPSQSPVMGMPYMPTGQSQGVRFDRSTKPQADGSQGQMGSSQRFTHPMGQQQGYGPQSLGGQYQPSQSPVDQYQQQPRMMQNQVPSAGIDPANRYTPPISNMGNIPSSQPMPQSAVISSSGGNVYQSVPGQNTAQMPSQSTSSMPGQTQNSYGQNTSAGQNMGNVQTGMQSSNERQDFSQTTMPSSTQHPSSSMHNGAQIVPSGHPLTAGIQPPVYGETFKDRQVPANSSSQGQNTTYQQPNQGQSSSYEQMGQGQSSFDPKQLNQQPQLPQQNTMPSQGQMYASGGQPQFGQGNQGLYTGYQNNQNVSSQANVSSNTGQISSSVTYSTSQNTSSQVQPQSGQGQAQTLASGGVNQYGVYQQQQGFIGQGQNLGQMPSQQYGQQPAKGQMQQPGQNLQGHIQHGQNIQGHTQPGQNLQGNIQPGQNLQGNVQPGQNLQGNSQPGQNIQSHTQPGQNVQGHIPGKSLQGHIQPGQNVQGIGQQPERIMQNYPQPVQNLQGPGQQPQQNTQGPVSYVQGSSQNTQNTVQPGQNMQGPQQHGPVANVQTGTLPQHQSHVLPSVGMPGQVVGSKPNQYIPPSSQQYGQSFPSVSQGIQQPLNGNYPQVSQGISLPYRSESPQVSQGNQQPYTGNLPQASQGNSQPYRSGSPQVSQGNQQPYAGTLPQVAQGISQPYGSGSSPQVSQGVPGPYSSGSLQVSHGNQQPYSGNLPQASGGISQSYKSGSPQVSQGNQQLYTFNHSQVSQGGHQNIPQGNHQSYTGNQPQHSQGIQHPTAYNQQQPGSVGPPGSGFNQQQPVPTGSGPSLPSGHQLPPHQPHIRQPTAYQHQQPMHTPGSGFNQQQPVPTGSGPSSVPPSHQVHHQPQIRQPTAYHHQQPMSAPGSGHSSPLPTTATRPSSTGPSGHQYPQQGHPSGQWTSSQNTNLNPATPKPSYSSTSQQQNPLSPPDILPQPILPSPIKPECQPSLQDVTMETTKQEVHPRSRESPVPVVQRKQPEKTHSRSSSNTSQSEIKIQSRKHSSSSIGSSLDDILSSSPLDSTIEPPKPVLTPKVLTAQEIVQQKEEAIMKGTLGRQFSKDPYPDSTKMDKFIAETEKLAKFVESLSKATCSGPSHLDIAWKEIIEDHDIHGKKHSMAIGRCYPMKNRDQDVLPYDETRVLLQSHKDDYINASCINDLAEYCPKFIATQAPLHSTLFDFWLMVYEQGCEVIVMLSSEVETKDTKKFPDYWPSEKGKITHHGPITLTLQSYKDCGLWVERNIYLQHQQTKQGRTIVQLQFKNWPVSGFPEKVPNILQFIHEVHNFYRQQRSLLKPVMVHCSNGIGRTGTFLMIYTGVQEIDHGNGIIDLQAVARKMLQQRRSIIREKNQLKFCYEAVLFHAQDILAKQGILVHKASFGGKLPQPGEKSYQWTPTDDGIFGSSCSITDLKSNVEKLGLNLGSKDQQSSPKRKPDQKQEISNKETEKVQQVNTPPNTEEQKREGTLLSGLPDVVQRTDGLGQSREQNLPDGKTDLKKELEPEKALTGFPLRKVQSRDSSPKPSSQYGSRDSSPKPSSKYGSHEGSPKLQSLLDPSTFSIGSDSGKKKITKSSFMEKTSSLSDNVDSNDPLSSLDPLWSLKK